MSYNSLVSDIKSSLDYPVSKLAPENLKTHAEKFASAIDNYTLSLVDPAKRPPITTGPTILSSLLIASILLPNPSGDAEIPSMVYATAISTYVAAIQISKSPIFLMIGGIVVPPGTPSSTKLNDLGVFTSIKSDFKDIFSDKSPEGLPQEAILLLKSKKMADAIKKGIIDKTSVSISGNDSTIPTPIPFSISGPLEEP